MSSSRIDAVHPHRAIEGGRIDLDGAGFSIDLSALPEVRIGDLPARLVYGSSSRIGAIVPAGVEGGRAPVTIGPSGGDKADAFVDVGSPFATGLHQVDNPVFDD